MALLFTSEIKGIQAMDGQRKLENPGGRCLTRRFLPPAVPGHGTTASPGWRAAGGPVQAEGGVSDLDFK